MIAEPYYQPAAADVWTGRIDGTDKEVLRWHQHIQAVHLLQEPLPPLRRGQKGIALLGFACDEGVRRNKGRTGAAQGPAALRRACANLPVHFAAGTLLIDAGDIVCNNRQLEAAQDALTEAVQQIVAGGFTPVLLGGGHEITYGHARGIYNAFPAQPIGLVNFDAHFDLRTPNNLGATSGTGFMQLARDCYGQQKPFHYLALGIQAHSNTQQLFRVARELEVQEVPAGVFHMQDMPTLKAAVAAFLRRIDRFYLTIDLDVFAAPYAPGVSATAYNGILPHGAFMECYRLLLQSGRLAGLDIAELNPAFDIDDRTAKLGAALLFEAVINL
jgi:formiminoglutamase